MAKVKKREGKNGVSWQIDYFDPYGKRVRKSFKKKKDAEAELRKRVSFMAEKRYLDVKKEYTTTLKELIHKYTENFKDQASFRTWKNYCLNNFKEHFGEDTLLANIRYVDLETYRNHLKQKPTLNGGLRSTASINREMSCLHHIIMKGVEWDMVERNPFDRGKSLIMKENNKRLRFLSQEEIAKLLAECPSYLKPVVECALNTGMRRGENLSLKWEQIRNGLIYLTKTKTNDARQVPVNNTLEAMFKKMRKQNQLRSEYVFLGRGVKAAKRLNSIKRGFNAAVKRAGIEDFKFHDLRHTFASHLVMNGASLKEVQEILGHKTLTMTLRYAHLSQESKKKAVNLLTGLTALYVKSDMSQNCHKSETRLFSNPETLAISGRDAGI